MLWKMLNFVSKLKTPEITTYESTKPRLNLLGGIPEDGCPPRKLTHDLYLSFLGYDEIRIF
jgi:hypothetical protein